MHFCFPLLSSGPSTLLTEHGDVEHCVLLDPSTRKEALQDRVLCDIFQEKLLPLRPFAQLGFLEEGLNSTGPRIWASGAAVDS